MQWILQPSSLILKLAFITSGLVALLSILRRFRPVPEAWEGGKVEEYVLQTLLHPSIVRRFPLSLRCRMSTDCFIISPFVSVMLSRNWMNDRHRDFNIRFPAFFPSLGCSPPQPCRLLLPLKTWNNGGRGAASVVASVGVTRVELSMARRLGSYRLPAPAYPEPVA